MNIQAQKFPDTIDREEIERLAGSIERDTGRLLEMMHDKQRRELIGKELCWVALANMRLNVIMEDFTRGGTE